jgi:GTP-binding protein Era
MRAGFAALIGRPNVGKSTLINALVGSKISIVTPRPQTTRQRIVGIAHLPEAQIALVDTPGLHLEAKRALNKAMNRAAASAALDADVVVLVVVAGEFTEQDALALKRAQAAGRPLIAAVNKIDAIKPRSKLLPYLAELATRADFAAVVPISALRGESLERLTHEIAARLPESPALFAAEDRTDRDLKFRIAETVREKLTLQLNQEVPYGIAVQVEDLAQSNADDPEQWVASVVIWVEREGQKPIVIGKQGERLKRVGSAARRELNATTGQRFHLTLWVRVREGWADNARALASLGFE